MGNRKICESPPILNTNISIILEGDIFFSLRFARRKMDNFWSNQRMWNLISLSGMSDFIAKKGEHLSEMEIIKCILILIFNRSI